MKLDRRTFLKMSMGAAAGLPLTPLPWKLMDDAAIWTQNHAGIPKLAKNARVESVLTVCTLCPGGCGLEVSLLDDGRVIKVRGAKNAPVNNGGICPIGAAAGQYHYSPSRIQTPLIRTGQRGSGKFQRISWDTAISEVAKRLMEIRGKGRGFSVALINGRTNSLVEELMARFMLAFGSPNLVDMPSGIKSRASADLVQLGPGLTSGFDLENSDYILSFGCGLIEGWGSPVSSMQAFSAWQKNGARLVQLESRGSKTAARADDWVPIRPGSETALALSIAQVIMNEGRYDHEFVGSQTTGFESFRALVNAEYTPERVAPMAGITVAKIKSLAIEFASAKNPVAVSGKGQGREASPLYELMAISALNALLGNINQAGGMTLIAPPPLTPWPEFEPDERALETLKAPRLDKAGALLSLGLSNIKGLTDSINQGRYYPAKAMIFHRANPAHSAPDPEAFRKALKSVPLLVSLSGMMDETAAFSDIILPESANFESMADVMNPPGLPYPLFGASGPALENPLFDTAGSGDIFLALAVKMGGSIRKALPWKSYSHLVREKMEGLYQSGQGRVASGLDDPESSIPVAKFKTERSFFRAMAKGRFWVGSKQTSGFNIASVKFEFLSSRLKSELEGHIKMKGEEHVIKELNLSKGGDRVYMPHHEDAFIARPDDTFPLILLPFEEYNLVNSSLGNAPHLTKLLSDKLLRRDHQYVEINPETASSLELAEGDQAWLATSVGGLAVLVHLSERAKPGSVYASLGLGHRAYDRFIRGKGVNPLEIIKPVIDPLSGQALTMVPVPANLTRL